MGRHLDWYLVEIERLLKGYVDGPRLAETMSEVEAHLQDSAEDLAPTCRHGQNSEELAIERFGSPWAFAKATVGQAGLRPYWRAAWLPMLVCFLTALLPAIAIYSRTWAWSVAWLGVLGFCVACWFARRWMPVATGIAVLAAAGVTLLLGTLFCAPTRPFDFCTMRYEVPALLKANGDDLKQKAADLATLSRGMAYFAAAKPRGNVGEFFKPAGYLVPSLTYYNGTYPLANGPAGGLVLRYTHDLKEARASWKGDGPKLVAQLTAGAGYLRLNDELFRAALRSDRRDAFNAVAPAVGVGAAVFYGLILVLNSLAATAANFAATAKLTRRRLA